MSVSPVHSDSVQTGQDRLLCDLVMKGGITSGIVYPPAILNLKGKYTFRNIGGTSAGAIAAAGVASAEFNRATGGQDAGFHYLQTNVQEWLSTGSNLRNLFKASKATKPLMDFAYALLPTPSSGGATSAARKKPGPLQTITRLLRAWLVNYPPISSLGAVLGAIVGIILFVSFALAVFAIVYLVSPTAAAYSIQGFTIVWVILGILGAWLGCQIGGVISAIMQLPKNFYGICTGNSTNADGQPDISNLTGWLSNVLDEMAGKDHTVPITFGDLSKKGINLKMVTSNLSHGLPYVMPGGLHNFIFKKSEMLELFPPYVVEHMIRNQPDPDDQDASKRPLISRAKLPEDCYFLPNEEKLPVIVCTRMSLSFPILLSAIPLYTISTQDYNDIRNGKIASIEAESLQRNWFSDGGLCSNFPIQFFDAWLPTLPTFGVNLAKVSSASATSALQENEQDAKLAAAAARAADDEPVYLPQAEDWQDLEWDNVEGVLNFGNAIFKTAQNYRDTMQANLPSYRERIVQIRLNNDEGGLNLTMPEEIIRKVTRKGDKAGEILNNEFNLDHHIWVRFLVLMAQLEENVIEMQDALKNPDFENRMQLQLTQSQVPQSRYPFCKDKIWVEQAISRVEALRVFIAAWNISPKDKEKKPCFFRTEAPLPKPALNVTPEI